MLATCLPAQGLSLKVRAGVCSQLCHTGSEMWPGDKQSYHGVGVRDEVFKGVQEALVLHQLGINIVELCYTHSSRLPHIRVFVLQTFPQRFTEVLCDLVHANAAHCTNSKGTDERVGVFTILSELVNQRDD